MSRRPFPGRAHVLAGLLPLAALAPLAVSACGSSGASSGGTTGSGGQGGAGPAGPTTGTPSSGTGFGGGNLGSGGQLGHGAVVSLSIEPPVVTLDLLNGTPGAQKFQAIAHYADKTTAAVNAGHWAADGLAIGSIDGTGLFSANGAQGGVVTVTGSNGGKQATATLTVALHVKQNPAGASGPVQAQLAGAAPPDPAVTWAYPYDQTVFPRGIGEPTLMWQGGTPTDLYYVHLTSPTFELATFFTASPTNYDFDPQVWDHFLSSTSGPAELKVNRLSNNVVTQLVDQHWTVAPGAMRGTIYYWAINTGRVMRIKPGAAAPDDFLGPGVNCPSCHTVAANGSRLVMNEGGWPNETSIAYNLKGNANDFSGYFSGGGGASQWALPAVSADGKVVVENFAPLRGGIGQAGGAFDAVTGMPIAGTGLDGLDLWMPAFAPDDKLLSYIDGGSKDLRAFDWDEATQKATNDRLIVAAGGDANTNVVSFPTGSPDHQWVLYQRSGALGSLGNPSDLYIASVAHPGMELPLDNLNGSAYPFAAGDRDRHLNYEPTFAPVAAGGYFWVVFHSRRTFGNLLTGPGYSGEGAGTKQLWVAAIDQNPTPGKDPSHPAFHLPGQDLGTLNMRGYWALDPCKGDGQGCAEGIQCCGGFCDGSGDGGQPVCKSSSNGGCSQNGDHCNVTADCCNAPAGVTCINHVCSESTPK